MPDRPICDYEGSDYQSTFWDSGDREYEDRVEAIALRRLLPPRGKLLLELGAGAGRNTPRYGGFERIVLLDYSRTQLEEAQRRLGQSDRFVYLAADVNRLPFVEGLFDAATMIRVLHHMVDAPAALEQVRATLCGGGIFILEFASKLNTKAILRYGTGRQEWSPFSPAPIEFAALNFDFHPRTVMSWLQGLGFRIERILTVSHFRIAFLKRWLPVSILVAMDSALQWTGSLWQLTPSVFLRARLEGDVTARRSLPPTVLGYFKCPECGHADMAQRSGYLECRFCKRHWSSVGNVYDFRQPIQ